MKGAIGMASEAHKVEYAQPRRSVEPSRKPVLQVKTNVKKQKRRERFRVAGMILCAAVMLFLICGVLYTQSTIAELQTSINTQNKQLAEVNTENRNLVSQLDSKVNLKTIEDQAASLGLVKMENSQKVYIRSHVENKIVVQENGLTKLLKKPWGTMLNAMDYLNP